MDSKEIVLAILKRQMRSQRSPALQLGIPPQTLNNRLKSSRDLCVGDYAAMLDALGYELKVVPKATVPSFPSRQANRDLMAEATRLKTPLSRSLAGIENSLRTWRLAPR